MEFKIDMIQLDKEGYRSRLTFSTPEMTQDSPADIFDFFNRRDLRKESVCLSGDCSPQCNAMIFFI